MGESMIHELKTWPEFFAPLARGEKTFELRRGDRVFSVGDLLDLREWSKCDGYTGREVVRRVTYTLTDPVFLAVGYVALGLAPVEWQPIAIAPKDGTRILVYVIEYGTKYWACVRWQEFGDGSKGWIGATFTSEPEGHSTTCFLPSHWTPLPAPPEENARTGHLPNTRKGMTHG